MEDAPDLIRRCLAGEAQALEQLIRSIQGRVYNLAVRFYWNPADAEDATQEILIRIITNLATFRGESAFDTWAHRVASNYLLNSQRRPAEQLTFSIGAEQLREGLRHGDYALPDQELLGGGGENRVHHGHAHLLAPRAAASVHPRRDSGV